jgi:hypothetical protein
VNICHGKKLILENMLITLPDIACSSDVSVVSFNTIVHEHLLLMKMCAWWAPNMLTFDQKAQLVTVPAKHKHLHWLELEGNTP